MISLKFLPVLGARNPHKLPRAYFAEASNKAGSVRGSVREAWAYDPGLSSEEEAACVLQQKRLSIPVTNRPNSAYH